MYISAKKIDRERGRESERVKERGRGSRRQTGDQYQTALCLSAHFQTYRDMSCAHTYLHIHTYIQTFSTYIVLHADMFSAVHCSLYEYNVLGAA